MRCVMCLFAKHQQQMLRLVTGLGCLVLYIWLFMSFHHLIWAASQSLMNAVFVEWLVSGATPDSGPTYSAAPCFAASAFHRLPEHFCPASAIQSPWKSFEVLFISSMWNQLAGKIPVFSSRPGTANPPCSLQSRIPRPAGTFLDLLKSAWHLLDDHDFVSEFLGFLCLFHVEQMRGYPNVWHDTFFHF